MTLPGDPCRIMNQKGQREATGLKSDDVDYGGKESVPKLPPQSGGPYNKNDLTEITGWA